MLAVQRTHRWRADRDWLPVGVRRLSSLVRGGIWGATGAAILGTVIAAPWTLGLTKFYVFGAAGLAVAGERAGHAVFQRQLAKMTRGEVQLAEVSQRAEGELVVVRGTVVAEEQVRGVLLDTSGVYRRMFFAPRGKWVHEAAVNFALIDDAGHRILIEAAGARWITEHREPMLYPASRFAGEDVPARVRELVGDRAQVPAYERVLTVGTRVQIVGYKTDTPDATGEVRDYRTAPQRATLRSGLDLPLVITKL